MAAQSHPSSVHADDSIPEISTCPSCESGKMEIFYEAASVPSNSCILLGSQEEAENYPRGTIRLGFCPDCGFISNVTFDQKLTEYSGRYEETQGFSGTFNAFHKALAQRLIDRYDLHDKDVIEIGCGKGEFLVLLSELGNNRGTGFDPGFVAERINSPAQQRSLSGRSAVRSAIVSILSCSSRYPMPPEF